MKAIHCFSSRPVLAGRTAAGLFDDVTPKIPEATLLFMKLSALQWRRTNGSIKLYTDIPVKNFLDRRGLLSCWNETDTDVLENFYRDNTNIRHDTFWSAGKFAAYLSETAPFVCIDTDLAVWKTLDLNGDFMFAHWESIEEGDASYPDLTTLSRPKGYRLTVNDSVLFKTHACNMAVTYFGNDDFKNEFTRLALDFMTDNNVDAAQRYATPEILYSEQRLPLALLLKQKLSFRPILNLTWSPLQFKITHCPPEYKYWFFSNLDTQKPFTHLWFHKKYLAENPTANADYCAKLRTLIADAEEGLRKDAPTFQ